MGTLHPFRRLRWGEPRKLPTPHFLREDQSRARSARLRRFAGWLVLAALIAAILTLGFW
jgi:hypothetical protein